VSIEQGAQVRALVRPPSSLCKPHVSGTTLNRAFPRGFPATHFPDFGLCRRSRILEAIFGALSLHPKIPFPAAGIEFRTDNGVPFASPNALFNLSKLSVWGSASGLRSNALNPATRSSGRHERMHLTLKLETTKPAARNFLQQQAKFDDFIDCYNNEWPHQALDMQCPAQRYRPSPRPYRGLPDSLALLYLAELLF
jgi:transposase InsO family protein